MIYLLIVVAALSRFLPHPPNVACLGALGLFAGCYLQSRRAYLVPAAALLLSDLLGQLFGSTSVMLYHPMVMAGTYAAVTLSVPIGRWVRSRAGRAALKRVPLAAVSASTLFFLTSNTFVWLGPWYPNTADGLMSCFVNALPFYGYTIIGDLVYCGLMFGCFEFASRGYDASLQQRLASQP
ncbi:MAG: DUF6580 family putative transport protein [Planctomycetota bacterium]